MVEKTIRLGLETIYLNQYRLKTEINKSKTKNKVIKGTPHKPNDDVIVPQGQ